MRKDLAEELLTLEIMVRLYCRGRHGGPGLCRSCGGLLAYSRERLARCPHDPKPACRDCAAHCYSGEYRARIKEVMRYSGPRMLLRRPLLALKHYLTGKRAGAIFLYHNLGVRERRARRSI